MNLWDQQSDEPGNWFDRFERYRLLGSNRAKQAVYNAERSDLGKPAAKAIPKPWRDTSDLWNWQSRAEAWDEFVREERRAAEDQKRQTDRARAVELRQVTIRALQAILGKVITAQQEQVAKLSMKDLKDLAQAAATIMKETRLEFGEPTSFDVSLTWEDVMRGKD